MPMACANSLRGNATLHISGAVRRYRMEWKCFAITLGLYGSMGDLYAVNVPLLRAVSSVVNGVLRHGFITDHRTMLSRFTQLARRTCSHLRLLYLHYGGYVCRRYCI